MSRICELCGKKTQVGNTRSHAMNANKRKFKANLQKVSWSLGNGLKYSTRLCTKCIRTLNKTPKLRKIDLKKLATV